MGLSFVYFISLSVTLTKLYGTHFFLATSFGSVKSHHQAINKNYKSGNSVCYMKEISPLHREYIVNVIKPVGIKYSICMA
jgi:hypothetical protein